MSRLILLTGILSIVALTAKPPEVRSAPPTPVNGKAHSSLDDVDQLVIDYLEQYKIPGVTVACAVDGRLVFEKGYGLADADKKIPMQPTHRTLIGSVSKVLTTAAVMKLHEMPRNGFTVDKKMYGPTGVFKSKEYAAAIIKSTGGTHPVTSTLFKNRYYATHVTHLLSHSAGWNGSGNASAAAAMFNVAEEDVTPKHNHLYFISTRVPLHQPGTKYMYSNRSVGVMDDVIETVSGESYASFVKKHVLSPIGLTHVAAIGDPVTSRDAAPHKYVNGGSSFSSYKLEARSGSGSAGGWRATATDLVRFMVATDRLNNHSDILKPQTLDLMEKRPFPTTVPNRALGWGVSVKGDGKWLSHNGLGSGCTAYMAKATPGYVASDGTDLSHVSVAVCGNIRKSSGIKSLAVKIARLAGKSSIPVTYDLFNSPSFAVNK